MITGVAHTGVSVPDCDAAVRFYRDVLGMTVLSPPYVMDNDAIRDDMGELMPDPRMKAAIVGFGPDGGIASSRSSNIWAATATTRGPMPDSPTTA